LENHFLGTKAVFSAEKPLFRQAAVCTGRIAVLPTICCLVRQKVVLPAGK
jgi:hypothetical protein